MRWLIRLVLQLFFRTNYIGKERLAFSGPTIILPNHVSFLDAVFLYAYLPANTCFVINTAIAKKISFVLKYVDYVAVDPLNPYSLKKIVSVIRNGQPVVLFPEGRITTTGNLMKIYSGVGFIALKTGAAVLPVIFSGLEYSKFSRIKDKVKSYWFPQVTMYINNFVHLNADSSKSFKLQKKEVSDKILTLLQNAKFAALQAKNSNSNIFNEMIEAGELHSMSKTMASDISGSISYRKALIGGYTLGQRLRKSLKEEENVAILLPNSIGHLITLLSLCYIAKTPAILNFSAGIQNNIDCAQTAKIKSILTSRIFIEKANLKNYIDELAEHFQIIYLEDVKEQISVKDKLQGLINYLYRAKAYVSANPRLILFTSGSESKPKGVVLRQSNVLANVRQISCVIDYTPRDKMLNALPMFHSFGLTAGTLLPILSGIEVFLYPSPLHYKVIPEIAYDINASILLGTPSFLHGYAKYAHHYDFYNMRYVLAGGEKVKDDVRKIWQDKFGIRIFEGYGTTETSPVLSLNTPLFNKSGTVGKFLLGIEWSISEIEGIIDGGNLKVKGPNVMEGYLLYERGFAAAGEWYDCGDVVSIDQEGFITIKSRLKRFAKISGEMVSLDAVERAAEQCFGTDRNAAVSIAGKKGEMIILYTQSTAATKHKLRDFFSQTRFTMLAMPSQLVTVDSLPLLGSGKIDYVALKAVAEKEYGKDDV
ncbi:AMP-binding protein [Dendrosporobacter sp. 1207_IL3150]|uniref:AMP-binding protein n=1 Tax=Dendrosporobacter sp. 1207_IL3150 TaxID=3084054 RepID=UPI002FD96109